MLWQFCLLNTPSILNMVGWWLWPPENGLISWLFVILSRVAYIAESTCCDQFAMYILPKWSDSLQDLLFWSVLPQWFVPKRVADSFSPVELLMQLDSTWMMLFSRWVVPRSCLELQSSLFLNWCWDPLRIFEIFSCSPTDSSWWLFCPLWLSVPWLVWLLIQHSEIWCFLISLILCSPAVPADLCFIACRSPQIGSPAGFFPLEV